MGIAINTLEYARRLREAGFSEQQAEGQAQALAAAMTDTLATKPVLQELRYEMQALGTGLRHGMQELATELRREMQELATELRREMRELDSRMEVRFERIDARFGQIDIRFEELEKRLVIRLVEMESRTELRLEKNIADLERRMTMRLGGIMVAGISVMSVLTRIAGLGAGPGRTPADYGVLETVLPSRSTTCRKSARSRLPDGRLVLPG